MDGMDGEEKRPGKRREALVKKTVDNEVQYDAYGEMECEIDGVISRAVSLEKKIINGIGGCSQRAINKGAPVGIAGHGFRRRKKRRNIFQASNAGVVPYKTVVVTDKTVLQSVEINNEDQERNEEKMRQPNPVFTSDLLSLCKYLHGPPLRRGDVSARPGMPLKTRIRRYFTASMNRLPAISETKGIRSSALKSLSANRTMAEGVLGWRKSKGRTDIPAKP